MVLTPRAAQKLTGRNKVRGFYCLRFQRFGQFIILLRLNFPMINFTEFYLSNGLQVIVHEDPSVQIVALNVLYRVGSRDEDPEKTGFAHLFEHLMFGGSIHIPNYDEQLQRAGGENNDITNYYLTLPAANIETGFWLESDRMLNLAFSKKSLDVQRKVVIEEFKQSYLDPPYGDAWLKLCPLSYQQHPYRWPTIGKDMSHIENATLEDVKDFFARYYVPNNAVLTVAGNVSLEQVKTLCEKWFAPIASGKKIERQIPAEPKQREKRTEFVEADVPADALYKTYHTCGRFEADFLATDLLGDVLGRGDSSRLHYELVHRREIFTRLSAHATGSLDPGLLMISGRLREGITFEQAEKELGEVLQEATEEKVSKAELEKVKNQYEASIQMEHVEVFGRAMSLAFASLSGDAHTVNREMEAVEKITPKDLKRAAVEVLREDNSTALYYKSKK